MHIELATERLKTGETLTVECVSGADEARAVQIEPFLAHKPSHYVWHVEQALAGQCDGLETRFYIGLLDGEMVGNIMTVEADGVGILGHVHTRADQRRKGICQAIMSRQMADFRRRGGHVLLLGTGYQSPPYRIYESFGFRDWKVGRPGWMRYDNPDDPEFETRFYATAPVRPRKATFRDWPLVSLLASVPSPVTLRSLTLGVWGTALLEGGFSSYFRRYGDRSDASTAVLESETGAVMALATCVPDERWNGAVLLLDILAHPAVGRADLTVLLKSMPLSDGRVRCYADPRDSEKIAALESVGFNRAAILPEQFREGDTWHDAWLYASRQGS